MVAWYIVDIHNTFALSMIGSESAHLSLIESLQRSGVHITMTSVLRKRSEIEIIQTFIQYIHAYMHILHKKMYY